MVTAFPLPHKRENVPFLSGDVRFQRKEDVEFEESERAHISRSNSEMRDVLEEGFNRRGVMGSKIVKIITLNYINL